MDFIYFIENFFFLICSNIFFSSLKDMSHHLVEHLLTIWLYSGDTGLQVMLFMKVVSANTAVGDYPHWLWVRVIQHWFLHIGVLPSL